MAEAFASNLVVPLGPQLEAFKAKVAEYLGGGVHCVGLSSGSAALHLALRIVGVWPGALPRWATPQNSAQGIAVISDLGS